eukprot:TRINITY_DN1640_c0_g2_i2.p2 TRINITY_DN1640_c0_g2~~TRINITY_DN1640_c0_g2_i2.p2  ORF type:complete len:256 (+),score=38.75 TRINITY_DN1640_c0_g2_i2:112-879(+)
MDRLPVFVAGDCPQLCAATFTPAGPACAKLARALFGGVGGQQGAELRRAAGELRGCLQGFLGGGIWQRAPREMLQAVNVRCGFECSAPDIKISQCPGTYVGAWLLFLDQLTGFDAGVDCALHVNRVEACRATWRHMPQGTQYHAVVFGRPVTLVPGDVVNSTISRNTDNLKSGFDAVCFCLVPLGDLLAWAPADHAKFPTAFRRAVFSLAVANAKLRVPMPPNVLHEVICYLALCWPYDARSKRRTKVARRLQTL